MNSCFPLKEITLLLWQGKMLPCFFFSAKVSEKHTSWCCGAGLCSGVVLFLDAVLGSFLVLCSDIIIFRSQCSQSLHQRQSTHITVETAAP